MPRLAELQNRVVDLQTQFDELTASGELSPEDSQRATELSGRLAEARDALVDEAAAVQRENERLAAEARANPHEAIRDAAELVFGPRAEFTGIEVGWENRVPLAQLRRAQLMARNAISGLTTPVYPDYELPAPIAPIMGFLDTLPHGTTDGNETYFKSPLLTNNAAGWVAPNTKAESALSWTRDTANIETIAHHMPIDKQTARRYRSLENTVVYSLMLGLAIIENRYSLNGSNSSGIVGARNQSGILVYEKQLDDKYVNDLVYEMAMRVRIATGFSPDYIVMSPYTATAMRKAKDANDRYVFPELVQDGKIAGMPVVEDMEMTTVTTSGEGANATTTMHHALGVYFSGGAVWNTADDDEITIGLVNDQLVKNAYTLLAEGTHALKMPFPGAFCFCEEV